MLGPRVRRCSRRPTPEASWPRRGSVHLARVAMLGCLLSLIFFPEYVQGLGDPASKSSLYSAVMWGFRVIDLLVLLLFLTHAFALGCSRRRAQGLPRKLFLLLAGFGAAIAVSFVYGAQHGGRNLFFDWRALALGVALYVVYRFWIHTEAEARMAAQVFAFVMAVRVAVALGAYFAGHGDSLLGVRIPLFDGPTISAAVFTALLGLRLSARDSNCSPRGLWLLLSGLSALLVMLCFRRSYWAELGIGALILALTSSRHRLRNFMLPAGLALAASLAMGPALWERLASVNFTQWDAPYSGDNVDHVGDVLDAWDQVRASPWMGIGLGRSYPTWRIRNWKDESVMVHNAPLHVWLKYGLLGLGLYLAFHLCLFRCLRSASAAPAARKQRHRRRRPRLPGGAVPGLARIHPVALLGGTVHQPHCISVGHCLCSRTCMSLPSISVVTPTFNGAAYLEDAILSVKRQVGADIEHIVVDAASTDGTLEILRRYPNLSWISEPDRGQSDAINKGFRLATGELVGWLNADDYYLPGGLAAIARAAREHPEADVIHGDCVFVDTRGRIVRSKVEHEFDPQVLLYFGCYIPSTSTFFRRRLIERGLLLDCDYRVAMDFEYFARLARLGCKFHYVPQFIAAFRWHEDNVSLQNCERRAQERRMVQRAAAGHLQPAWELGARRYWARARRVMRKVTSGNIVREAKIRRRRGFDTRWMRAPEELRLWQNLASW